MTIRLNKVTRDLNVGIQTAVDFLHKKGFSIESSPNTKISDEQYEMLVKEFSTDKNWKLESERQSVERHNREKMQTTVVNDVSDKKIVAPEEIKIEIAPEFKPQFKQVGMMDLDALNKHTHAEEPKPIVKEEAAPTKAKEEPVVAVPVVAEPVVTQPIVTEPVTEPILEKTVVESVATESVTEKAVVEVEPVAKQQYTPIGKIDLDAINQTVPTKKTHKKETEKISAASTEKAVKKTPPVVVKKETEKIHQEKVVAKSIKEVITPQVAPVKKEKIVAEPVVTPTVVEAEIYTIDRAPALNTIKVMGTIDLSTLNQQTRPKKKSKEEKRVEREAKDKPRIEQKAANEADRKKRQRITKAKVEISNTQTTAPLGAPVRANNNNNNNNNNHNNNKSKAPQQHLKKPIPKVEVTEEDVQKQIKETLARLTSKGQKKGSKHRRDKREAFVSRQQEMAEQEREENTILKLTEFVTVSDLANMMDVPVNNVIGTCMSIGVMVSINQRLDAETINIVAEEFGFKTEYVSAEVVEAISEVADAETDLTQRPPIVTVMGHVDHGKTSLLDYIRSANVIAGEAGGITQHIGAYNVKLDDGRRITFLDTPGHEAFTAMRARGAKVTDIAIIIIAADDNVMPQTIEAINHASAAGVPIIFAINKVDKPTSHPEKIKETLAGMNYLVEDWGGKYQSQDISAKSGKGIAELMEKVLLEAEMLDLKANSDRHAVGSIIESTLDKGRGYVATVLVQNGTLKIGDIILAGTNYGRVKAMFNERNQRIDAAGPAAPALVLGFNGAPQAGDTFNVMETEQEARDIANKRTQLQRELGLRTQKILTLDDIGRRIAIGNFQELNVIVKGDVDGSVEALADSLIKLSTEEIQVNVIHKAVGQISESDISLAAASNAIVIGFQVRPSMTARRIAEKEGVEIRLYSIIYDAIEEVKSAMQGMLSPEIKEEITAIVEVTETFHITKVGTVAGCLVREGKIKRANKIRLIRDGIVIYSGDLGSLKRFKDDVKEVAMGYECGLNIEKFNDIKVGDMVESYEETEVQRTL